MKPNTLFEPTDFADAEYFEFISNCVSKTRQAGVDHDPYETFEIGAFLCDSGEQLSPPIGAPHGGPPACDTKSFDLCTQVIESQGSSVLKVNCGGSTGLGRAFVRQLHDEWGSGHAMEEYDRIDEEPVVVFDGSYDGWSAY